MVKHLIYATSCMIEGVILVCMMISLDWIVVVERIRGAKKEVMSEICLVVAYIGRSQIASYQTALIIVFNPKTPSKFEFYLMSKALI